MNQQNVFSKQQFSVREKKLKIFIFFFEPIPNRPFRQSRVLTILPTRHETEHSDQGDHSSKDGQSLTLQLFVCLSLPTQSVGSPKRQFRVRK